MQQPWWKRRLGRLPVWGWFVAFLLVGGVINTVRNYAVTGDAFNSPEDKREWATATAVAAMRPAEEAAKQATTTAKSDARATNDVSKQANKQATAVAANIAAATQAAMPTVTPLPTATPLEVPDQLIVIASAAVKDEADSKKEVLVEPSKLKGQSKWLVVVSFGIAEGFTAKGMKTTYIRGAGKAMKALHTSGLPVGRVSVLGYADITDVYGNTKPQLVARMILSEEAAAKINWLSFDYDNLPLICDDVFFSPAFDN